jgi:hypothetical protein
MTSWVPPVLLFERRKKTCSELGYDFFDTDFGEVLAMAFTTHVVLAAAILHDVSFFAYFTQHRGYNFGPGNRRLANNDLIALFEEEDAFEADFGFWLKVAQVDLKYIASLDRVLFGAVFHNRVHVDTRLQILPVKQPVDLSRTQIVLWPKGNGENCSGTIQNGILPEARDSDQMGWGVKMPINGTLPIHQKSE